MPEELVVDGEFEEPLETTTDEVKREEDELGNTDFDYVLDESDEGSLCKRSRKEQPKDPPTRFRVGWRSILLPTSSH